MKGYLCAKPSSQERISTRAHALSSDSIPRNPSIFWPHITYNTTYLTQTPAMASTSQLILKAVYRFPLSPTPHTFSQPLPSPSTGASPTDAKSEHLAALRTAVVGLQEEVNAYLTERMQEEKKAEEDAAAEEKYGEEGEEEED